MPARITPSCLLCKGVALQQAHRSFPRACACPNTALLSPVIYSGVVVARFACVLVWRAVASWLLLQAPEVLLTGQLRLRSDVYSFGILLWELVHLGIPLPCAGSSGLSCPSNTSQSGDVPISDPLACSDEWQDLSAGHTNLTASAGVKEEMHQLGPMAGLSAVQGRKSGKSVISSAYQELRATPWIIASKVIEGMRPVFVAPAVPGPYMELAKRCWEADPVRRPSFDEIVKLLEAVVQSDELAGVAPEGDLSSSCHIGSF